MITKTEILYAFSRLQEQNDLPENVNEFMRDAALSKLSGEELKEGGGMSSDQAVMAFAHHMNKQRGYETVHGTMYYNDADSDKPLTAVGIAEQWIQSQTGEQIKEG